MLRASQRIIVLAKPTWQGVLSLKLMDLIIQVVVDSLCRRLDTTWVPRSSSQRRCLDGLVFASHVESCPCMVRTWADIASLLLYSAAAHVNHLSRESCMPPAPCCDSRVPFSLHIVLTLGRLSYYLTPPLVVGA